MAWEERGNGRYYYRKRRVGSRVVSEYVGSGELATLLARWDELEQQEAALQRAAWEEETRDVIALEQSLNQLDLVVRALRDAAMVLNGYHRHKGQWRKRRDD